MSKEGSESLEAVDRSASAKKASEHRDSNALARKVWEVRKGIRPKMTKEEKQPSSDEVKGEKLTEIDMLAAWIMTCNRIKVKWGG